MITRLNITVHHFTDIGKTDPAPKCYYNITCFPDNKTASVADVFKQGGAVLAFAFKQHQCTAFHEVVTCIIEAYKAATKEDIDVCVLQNGIRLDETGERRAIQSGQIFSNGGFVSKIRQLNNDEYDLIFTSIAAAMSGK